MIQLMLLDISLGQLEKLCYNIIVRKIFKMSVKLVLLKSGEQVIADVKEFIQKQGHLMINNDDGAPNDKVHGYLFINPHEVSAHKAVVLTENADDNRNVEVTLSPWILLTEDKQMTVPQDWVITIVNPIKSILKLYEEKTNG